MPPERRILFAVHSARVGGAQLMALAGAERLARHHKLFIGVRRGPLRRRFAAHGSLVRASPVLPLGGGSRRRWLVQTARAVADALRLVWFIRRHDIGLVLTNSSVLLGPVLAARLAGVPAVVHARELPLDDRGRILYRALGTLADLVVAVSDSVASTFGTSPRARVVVIHDGIAMPSAPRPARGTFGSPLRLCLVGTLNGDGVKGQDVAVRALAALAARGVEADLELVGAIADHASEETLEALADHLGVAERVHLSGVSDRVGEIVEAADMLLSCSRSEGLGLTVVEAMARETPVVATRVGGVPEIVADGATGVLVAPDDPDAVADAVVALVNDPRAARAMAGAARIAVLERFDRERALDRLETELAGQLRTSYT